LTCDLPTVAARGEGLVHGIRALMIFAGPGFG